MMRKKAKLLTLLLATIFVIVVMWPEAGETRDARDVIGVFVHWTIAMFGHGMSAKMATIRSAGCEKDHENTHNAIPAYMIVCM